VRGVKDAETEEEKVTPAFKADAVRLCALGERSIGQVATDLDLTESALRGWVAGADVNAAAVKPRGAEQH
jgi:transposase